MKKRNKILAAALAIVLALCLLPATALAEPTDGPTDEKDTVETPAASTPEITEAAAAEPEPEESPLPTSEPQYMEAVYNEAAETLYAKEENLVYNNGGTVYNNGGTVYNNAGLVYNNGGLVYNNAGTVYSNGGTVYNNSGKVYNNGAAVYTNDGSVEDSVVYGYYKVEFSEDYSALADFEGLEPDPASGALLISQGETCTIIPKTGLTITGADTSSGKLKAQDDGSYVLSGFDENLTLTLRFKTAPPVFSLEPGTYSGSPVVELSAAEGAEIFCVTDGSESSGDFPKYTVPITLDEGMVIKAFAVIPGAEMSDTVEAVYAVPKLSGPKFEDVSEGYRQPAAQGIIVDNSGSADARIESVLLSGDDEKCFTLNRSAGGRVSAGAEDSRSWTVQPKAGLEKGLYSALVTFAFDSGDTVELKISFRVK